MPKFICSALIKAIDAFIEKADNDLEDKLNEAGFINAKESIKKESILEEVIAVILLSQSNNMAKHLLKNKGKIKGDFSDKQEDIREIINEFFENDTTKGEIQKAVESFYLDNIQEHTDGYIKSVSEDMAVERIRQRTFSKIEEWSEELSRLMKISQEKQLGKLIEDTLKAGGSVDDLAGKLMKEGIRNEYYQARRVAVTEMLRFNSIAQDEAMQQDPSVDKKEWKHTGSRKNNPRANHVNMNGQIVEKDKPYKLIGRNGSVHYPMYPRDTSLPAEESINCHCISQPILNDKVFGLSLEERRKLQQEIIDEDDRKWEEEYLDKKREEEYNEDETVKIAGVKRRKPMTFEEADSGNVNPNYGKEEGYSTNCQSCVPTFEARQRGYDVQTLPNTKGSKLEELSKNTRLAWIDPVTGKHPEFIFDSDATTPKKYLQFLKDTIEPNARYSIEFSWKGKGNDGHIVNLDLTPDGLLRLKDNQRGVNEVSEWIGDKEVLSYLSKIKYSVKVYGTTIPTVPKILRLDNMDFNMEMINAIMEGVNK